MHSASENNIEQPRIHIYKTIISWKNTMKFVQHFFFSFTLLGKKKIIKKSCLHNSQLGFTWAVIAMVSTKLHEYTANKVSTTIHIWQDNIYIFSFFKEWWITTRLFYFVVVCFCNPFNPLHLDIIRFGENSQKTENTGAFIHIRSSPSNQFHVCHKANKQLRLGP